MLWAEEGLADRPASGEDELKEQGAMMKGQESVNNKRGKEDANDSTRKNLYLIGGPMGVGKTAVCQKLKQQLDQCAFLEGDWCWDMDPLVVTDATKAMVLDNIIHVLTNFIACPNFSNVIFCWVMHEQSLIDSLLARLPLENCTVHLFTLVCDKGVLINRLEKDITEGRRASSVIPRSLERLDACIKPDSIKVDTSFLSPSEVAEHIYSFQETVFR